MISYLKKNLDILLIILIIIALGFSFFFLSNKISIKNRNEFVCNNNLEKTQPVTLPNLPPYGSDQALIKIVEFSDYLCSFCARTAVEFYPKIESLIKEGKIAIYYRDFPVHEEAKPIANAARCANEEGKFWEFNLKIFEKLLIGEDTTKKETWLNLGKELGLNKEQFENCINQNKYQKNVNDDLNYAFNLGLNGTPTFFVQSQNKAFKIVGIDEACIMSAINQLQK
ncbi:MAG: hypothetical protein KatS3mg093_170 [Candidatus Parcubacteria bacterium]|nr:MAG: hypothetical protein KatS3mg093_170 [Candidatus Parcubacteria bacterium]